MMRLKEIAEKLDLEARCCSHKLDNEVKRGYSSDLMSDVIAHGQESDLWVTLQIHVNTVAVASMKDLAGILIIGGREPQEQTIEKAEEENIPILVSKLTAFEVIGRLYNLGIPGI